MEIAWSQSICAKTIVINEVFASNTSRTYGSARTPDWIELYNTLAQDVDLGGMSLTTDPTSPRRWSFAAGTVIHAQNYLVVFCDGDIPASGYNTGFNLSANGDAVYLYDSAVALVDSIAFGFQVDDYSVGRLQPDADVWVLLEPTYEAPNTAVVTGDVHKLRVNEWMADPVSGGDWFELFNGDSKPVAVGGLYLSNALNKEPLKHRIAANSYIGTGSRAFQKIVADDDTAAGANHVNFKLGKSGDEIGIFISATSSIDTIDFASQSTGVSEGRLPDGAAKIVRFPASSSPQDSNYLPLTNIVINEVLTHTDLPQLDLVELANPFSTPVNITGWYLSDSASNFKKYKFPSGSVVPAFGYLLTDESQWTNTAYPFYFNSSEGDSVYLSAVDTLGNLTGYRAQLKFGPAPNNISFGRYTNSIGSILNPLQIQKTPGADNSGPQVGPVVVSEIMYNPPLTGGTGTDNVIDEYIELHNITSTNVPLFYLTEPTNTWRLGGEVSFQFPRNVALPPGGYLVVVSFDPVNDPQSLAGFLQRQGLSSSPTIFGPYSGKLANSGGPLLLEAPDRTQGRDNLNEGEVPYFIVEQVDYLGVYPWPTGAAGTGMALQRKDAFLFGNEPTNWFAGSPSLASAHIGAVTDHDSDGMPDDWELAYDLNVRDAADASLDNDGDGLTNLQEYAGGTSPIEFDGALRWHSIAKDAQGILLHVMTTPNRSYTIQYRSDLSAGTWQYLKQFTATADGGLMAIVDEMTGYPSQRYYRLLTP